MITLADYRRLTRLAHEAHVAGDRAIAVADNLEDLVARLAGCTFVDREPGFNGWQIEGLEGWFPTPEAAIAAKERLGE